MEFDYFYKRDGDRFSYYRPPELLVTDENFKSLSSDAKISYSCLLERTSLSFRNKCFDEENIVYIIFTVEEVMETLGRSNKTAVKILNELDITSRGIGLIERKKRVLGKPNIIYAKDFMSVFRFECKNYTSEVKNLYSRSEEFILQKCINYTSRNEELTTLITKLYEDHALGKIPVKHFDRLFNIYDTEQQDLDKQIQYFEQEIQSYHQRKVDTDKFLKMIEKYTDIEELTVPMINEYIE